VGTGPPKALDMAKPTSSLMNSKTLGAPAGARTGCTGIGRELATSGAMTPSKGAGGIGRVVRTVCAGLAAAIISAAAPALA